MKQFTESSIYKVSNQMFLNGTNVSAKIQAIAAGKATGTVIVNKFLENQLKILLKQKNSPIIYSIVEAVSKGRLILFTTTPEYNLPVCIPFVKYTKNGELHSMVNLTNYIRPIYGADKEILSYDIDVRELEALITGAYIDMYTCKKNDILPPQTMYQIALLWSQVFNKVLQRVIALSTNKEKYDAFVYFGIRFYLINQFELKPEMANALADKYLINGKNYFIKTMEENIELYNVQWTNDISDFCTMLFNNKITNTHGIKVKNISETMNTAFYYKKFIDTYNYSALMALASPSYFIFMLISAVHNKIVNYRTMEEFIKDNKTLNQVLITLFNEAK